MHYQMRHPSSPKIDAAATLSYDHKLRSHEQGLTDIDKSSIWTSTTVFIDAGGTRGVLRSVWRRSTRCLSVWDMGGADKKDKEQVV